MREWPWRYCQYTSAAITRELRVSKVAMLERSADNPGLKTRLPGQSTEYQWGEMYCADIIIIEHVKFDECFYGVCDLM